MSRQSILVHILSHPQAFSGWLILLEAAKWRRACEWELSSRKLSAMRHWHLLVAMGRHKRAMAAAAVDFNRCAAAAAAAASPWLCCLENL